MGTIILKENWRILATHWTWKVKREGSWDASGLVHLVSQTAVAQLTEMYRGNSKFRAEDE